MLQRNCSLVVYLAAFKDAKPVTYTHNKKDLRGFYMESKVKSPSLLKKRQSLCNITQNRATGGAKTLCHGSAFYLLLQNDWLCKDRKIFAMTLFEILNFNRELLERLAGTGYKAGRL